MIVRRIDVKQFSGLRWVVAFTVLYLGIAAITSLTTHNWEFLLYFGIVVIIGLCTLAIHHRYPLKPAMLWFLSLWGLMHMAGGLVPVPQGWHISGAKRVLYSLWLIPNFLKYDNIVHGVGFAIVTWIAWHLMRVTVHREKPTAGLLVLCVFAGMGLGSLNEIIEYIAVLTIPNTNVGGYDNTCLDLVANMAGAILSACLIWTFDKGLPDESSQPSPSTEPRHKQGYGRQARN